MKQILLRYNIPREKVCIVSEAILQVFALRKTKEFDDIDIIMTDDLREKYGKGLVILSDCIEMHAQNLYEVCENDIIMNTKYHFVENDLKFMHPGILYNYLKGHNNDEYMLLEGLPM